MEIATATVTVRDRIAPLASCEARARRAFERGQISFEAYRRLIAIAAEAGGGGEGRGGRAGKIGKIRARGRLKRLLAECAPHTDADLSRLERMRLHGFGLSARARRFWSQQEAEKNGATAARVSAEEKSDERLMQLADVCLKAYPQSNAPARVERSGSSTGPAIEERAPPSGGRWRDPNWESRYDALVEFRRAHGRFDPDARKEARKQRAREVPGTSPEARRQRTNGPGSEADAPPPTNRKKRTTRKLDDLDAAVLDILENGGAARRAIADDATPRRRASREPFPSQDSRKGPTHLPLRINRAREPTTDGFEPLRDDATRLPPGAKDAVAAPSHEATREDRSSRNVEAGDPPKPSATVPETPKAGRWSTREHLLFLKGLREHRTRRHTKIAELVKTRTARQVRSHEQKYLSLLRRARERGEEFVVCCGVQVRAGTMAVTEYKEVSPPPPGEGAVRSVLVDKQAVAPAAAEDKPASASSIVIDEQAVLKKLLPK